jgi:hypothetical protein
MSGVALTVTHKNYKKGLVMKAFAGQRTAWVNALCL